MKRRKTVIALYDGAFCVRIMPNTKEAWNLIYRDELMNRFTIRVQYA